MDEDDLNLLHARVRATGSAPRQRRAQRYMGNVMDGDGEAGIWASSIGAPRSQNRYPPAAIPAPQSPTLPVQLPLSPSHLARRPEWESSVVKRCEQSQAPEVDRGQSDQLP